MDEGPPTRGEAPSAGLDFLGGILFDPCLARSRAQAAPKNIVADEFWLLAGGQPMADFTRQAFVQGRKSNARAARQSLADFEGVDPAGAAPAEPAHELAEPGEWAFEFEPALMRGPSRAEFMVAMDEYGYYANANFAGFTGAASAARALGFSTIFAVQGRAPG